MTSSTLGRAAIAVVGLLVAIFVVSRTRGAHGETTSKRAAATAETAAATVTADHEAAERRAAAAAEARRARDKMRADILAALEKRAAAAPSASATVAAPAPKKPPSATATEQGERGHYEPSYIQEHFREDMFPLLRSCYDGALKRRPTLAGKLVMKFTIVGDPDVGGIVESAEFADESDLKDPEMETCTRESLMTLTFDKPPTGGGTVNVTYPVAFSPDPDPSENDGG